MIESVTHRSPLTSRLPGHRAVDKPVASSAACIELHEHRRIALAADPWTSAVVPVAHQASRPMTRRSCTRCATTTLLAAGHIVHLGGGHGATGAPPPGVRLLHRELAARSSQLSPVSSQRDQSVQVQQELQLAYLQEFYTVRHLCCTCL